MKNSIIQSLDRGLKILNVLGGAKEPLSLNDITSHFEIDRSSVFRLISTLIKNGFVVQDPSTKKYSLGYKVLELAGSYGEQSNIDKIIRPVMRRICGRIRQNTHLAVLDKDEVVFIAVEQPRESISLNIPVGTREPAASTALGKALVAHLDAPAFNEYMGRVKLKKHTDHSLTSRKEWRKNIETVRETRLAVDDEEYKQGISCFAAPIVNNRNEVLYSIGISGPSEIINRHHGEYSELVKQAGIEISALLGNARA